MKQFEPKPKLVCDHILRVCHPVPSVQVGHINSFRECIKCFTIMGE